MELDSVGRSLERFPRLPFLLPFGAAVGGISASWFFSLPGWGMAILGAMLLCAAMVGGRWQRAILWLGIFFAMAGIASLRGRDSPAARLAEIFPELTAVQGRLYFESSPEPMGEALWAGPAILTELVDGDGRCRPEVPVWVEAPGSPPLPGTVWEFRGSLGRPEGARNPGEFDRRAWLERQGIFSVVKIATPMEMEFAGEGGFGFLAKAGEAGQAWVSGVLGAGLEPAEETTGLVRAMMIGDTGGLDERVTDDFRRTGVYHLFSVSGLHVGMLGVLLWTGLGVMRVPRSLAAVAIIAALFYYALLTGWKPASVRAAVMASFVLLGVLVGRPSVVMNSLLAAGFFILVAKPLELFGTGFQLSFVVVAGLVVVVPFFSRVGMERLGVDTFIPRRLYTAREWLQNKAARWLFSSAVVSLVAWVVSIPILVANFHELPVLALPMNLVCVPLAFAMMATAMMALTAGIFSGFLAGIFNQTNWLLAAALLHIVKWASALPFAVVPVGVGCGGHACITVFDCGGGASIALTAGKETWLFDCGPRFFFRSTLMPYLRWRGVQGLKGIFLTHGDARHVGGAVDLLARMPVGRVVMGGYGGRSPVLKEVMERITASGLELEILPQGGRLAVGDGVEVEVLYPPEGQRLSLADDQAAVVAVEICGWRILFLSDAGNLTEQWLLVNCPEKLRCDFVVKGNHVWGSATLEEIWDRATPLALINSQSNFPPGEQIPGATREALAQRGIDLITQDVTGAVELIFFPDEVRAKFFLGGEASWQRAR